MAQCDNPASRILGRGIHQQIYIFGLPIEPMGSNGVTADQGVVDVSLVQ
jgi:hypothetical protein